MAAVEITTGISTVDGVSTLTYTPNMPGDSEAIIYAVGTDGHVETQSPSWKVVTDGIETKLEAQGNRYRRLSGRVSFESYGIDMSGENKWDGAILAPNGKLYAVPRTSPTILVIDTVNGTAERTDFGTTIPSSWGDGGWGYGGVLGVDGRIYCVPRDSEYCLIIDPVAETVTFDDFGLDLSGIGKWRGAVLGLDGKMYCAPRNETTILIVDTSDGTAIKSNMGASIPSGGNKWLGGALGPDGKIYCPPIERTDFLVIDPDAGTATMTDLGTTIPGTGDGWRGWVSGTIGADGSLWYCPNSSPGIAKIDTDAGTLTLSQFGSGVDTTENRHSAALAPNGHVYCPPFDVNARRVLDIDCIGNTASRSNLEFGSIVQGSALYTGAIVGFDGRVYCVPRSEPYVMVIETDAPINFPEHLLLSGYLNAF